ncbi:kinesin-like protein KIN-7I [Miscanthus floridulus]|uniref:kinesin-like protein KIN-7I n=1 Tax=Miscanthus floridulus TaxID=154761 RepID=UPI003459EC89
MDAEISSLQEALVTSIAEKDDLGMQLTDALLDMESERSIWTAKEKEYLEANHILNICLDENHKLSEDLIKHAVAFVKDEDSPEAAARKLTEITFRRGSNDNITCIVVELLICVLFE